MGVMIGFLLYFRNSTRSLVCRLLNPSHRAGEHHESEHLIDFKTSCKIITQKNKQKIWRYKMLYFLSTLIGKFQGLFCTTEMAVLSAYFCCLSIVQASMPKRCTLIQVRPPANLLLPVHAWASKKRICGKEIPEWVYTSWVSMSVIRFAMNCKNCCGIRDCCSSAYPLDKVLVQQQVLQYIAGQLD